MSSPPDFIKVKSFTFPSLWDLSWMVLHIHVYYIYIYTYTCIYCRLSSLANKDFEEVYRAVFLKMSVVREERKQVWAKGGLSCNKVLTGASGDPLGSSGSGMSLQAVPDQGRRPCLWALHSPKGCRWPGCVALGEAALFAWGQFPGGDSTMNH